jgi:hypothetical protein
MKTFKNVSQIREELQRLEAREAELKELIQSGWSNITGNGIPKTKTKSKSNPTPAQHEEVVEEESILVSVLAYAGMLLGRKLGVIVEDKIKDFLAEKEEE